MKSIIDILSLKPGSATQAGLSVCVFSEGLGQDTYGGLSLKAFAEGVKYSGDSVQLVSGMKYSPCDVAVIFGDVRDAPKKEKRMRLKAEIKGRHIRRGLIVIDTAVLTRGTPQGGQYRRIGLDGLLRDEADFVNADCPPNRWERISKHAGLNVRPWRHEGSHILFALQRPVDASLRSTQARRQEKYKEWVLKSAEKLSRFTSRPIHMRIHPASLTQEIERQWLDDLRIALGDRVFWRAPEESFSKALEGCWACIAFNSGAGVDAALSGIPVFAGDAGSFAWEIAGHDFAEIENPPRPDRMPWLHNLSYVEWSLDEMRAGEPWLHLKPAILRSI